MSVKEYYSQKRLFFILVWILFNLTYNNNFQKGLFTGCLIMGRNSKIIGLFAVTILFLILTVGSTAAAFEGGDGTAGNPYQIKTADQLNDVRNNLSADYILISDIDLAGTSYANNWVPIGKHNSEFKGNFEGNNHKIENLVIRFDDSNAGFFGAVNSSRISNLTLINADINVTNTLYSRNNTSSIAGRVVNSSIINCHVSGEIIGKGNVGGIAGGVSNSNIETCSFTGSIFGTSTGVGGIAGSISGNLTNCIVKDATINSSSGQEVGGIAGKYSGTDKNTIDNCTATGTVKVEGDTGNSIGGLVGYAQGSYAATPLIIKNSSSTASVTGYGKTAPAKDTGGLIGQSQGNITLESCAFSGTVTAYCRNNATTATAALNRSINTGGLIGNVFTGSSVTIKNSSVTGESITGSN